MVRRETMKPGHVGAGVKTALLLKGVPYRSAGEWIDRAGERWSFGPSGLRCKTRMADQRYSVQTPICQCQRSVPFAVETLTMRLDTLALSFNERFWHHPHVSIPWGSVGDRVADEVASKRDARLVSLGKKHPSDGYH